jgi:hypothetical protein
VRVCEIDSGKVAALDLSTDLSFLDSLVLLVFLQLQIHPGDEMIDGPESQRKNPARVPSIQKELKSRRILAIECKMNMLDVNTASSFLQVLFTLTKHILSFILMFDRETYML